jgi:hypothetical protein
MVKIKVLTHKTSKSQEKADLYFLNSYILNFLQVKGLETEGHLFTDPLQRGIYFYSSAYRTHLHEKIPPASTFYFLIHFQRQIMRNCGALVMD